MKKTYRKQGFTLIELLIVVAIIAILAAIAIPNFLEAQVRAKVSRAKSDMRSIATAQEAYMVDWNTYTYKDAGDNMQQPTYVEGLRFLTSPIAYITTLPNDSFGGYKDSPGWMKPMFEFGAGSATEKVSTGPPNNPNPRGMPADTFLIRSVGPDAVDDTNINSYPWPPTRNPEGAMNQTGVNAVLSQIYDPTNGTVSFGDIYRVGGVKPAGPQFDVLFAAASK